MSLKYMVAAWNARVKNPTRKLVLLKLADNANDDGWCWPSYRHIAEQCELSRSAVRQHVEDLIQMGYIQKINRLGASGTPNKSNYYRLMISADGAPTPVPADGTGDAPPMPPPGTGVPSTTRPVPPAGTGGCHLLAPEPVSSNPQRVKTNQLEFVVTEHLRNRALAMGVPEEQIERETQMLVAVRKQKGEPLSGPAMERAWVGWMQQAATWQRTRGTPASPEQGDNGPRVILHGYTITAGADGLRVSGASRHELRHRGIPSGLIERLAQPGEGWDDAARRIRDHLMRKLAAS